MTKHLTTALLLALALPLAACQRAPEPPAPPAPPSAPDASGAQTAIGRTVEKAINEAREELRTENISISNGPNININGREIRRASDQPKAEITPQGDLLIEGKAVEIDAAQRKLLLDYREHILAVAEAGMAMGIKGADLAGKAISETIGGLFSGNTGQVEQRIEAEAEKLEAEAKQLCAQLPPMLELQQQLSASLPAFKPYATMTREDIDDSMDGSGVAVTDGAEVREDIREGIRNGIRGGIQAAADSANSDESADAAAEAEAASTR